MFQKLLLLSASYALNHTMEPLLMHFHVCSPQKSFRTGTSTRLDDRVFAMCQLKYQPLAYAMLMIHPSLYRIDDLTDEVRRRKLPLNAFTSQLVDIYFRE